MSDRSAFICYLTFSSHCFQYFSLFSAFGVLIIMWQEKFLLWSNLFEVLQAFCMFMVISFFRLGKFSSTILLKIFTGTLRCKSSLSSIHITLRFGLLIVSWIFWMFWVTSFLHFEFSLTVVSIFSLVSSAPEILSYLLHFVSDAYICDSWTLY